MSQFNWYGISSQVGQENGIDITPIISEIRLERSDSKFNAAKYILTLVTSTSDTHIKISFTLDSASGQIIKLMPTSDSED